MLTAIKNLETRWVIEAANISLHLTAFGVGMRGAFCQKWCDNQERVSPIPPLPPIPAVGLLVAYRGSTKCAVVA